MSSIGVVVFRNSPLAKAQVLQESVNNAVNITNNGPKQSVRREIIIVKKKTNITSPTNSVSVTSLVRAAEPIKSNVLAKRPRIQENTVVVPRSPTPLAVARRNARERNRVRQVNDGFAALRSHIPDEVAAAFENANSNRGLNKKLSKVETLRMAVEYIRNLESLLNIGHSDKENSSRPSMESFPSPASSSPRENSQERSYFSMNSPAVDDDDLDEDDLDGSLHHLSAHHYVDLPTEPFQILSTPHLYEEEDGVQPLTPSSDLLYQDEVNSHILDGNFPFPNSAEQFTIIPEQSYCKDSDITINDSDFEVKYAETLHHAAHTSYDDEAVLPLETINADLILSHDQYKIKHESDMIAKNTHYNDIELKKELPDIQVTPEDREQFEETLKWWQEKTRQSRPLTKNNN